ncbi:MAG: YfhO family protein [Chitinophagaceae bacterium]|nr:YfhO family protein [Chitinophagaceae bacterium]
MRLLLSFEQNKINYKNYLLLLVICLLAYWPLTFGIFSVKNDAIHYFLPYRFHISEAIRNGEMPFWSPYIYLGNPMYGDMQSGSWNPIVWFFSLIGRYDVTLFHYENLLYIFLAGVGMYKLSNRLVQHSHTALLIAVSYMLSGFMLSGQLINWLAAAAFIPLAIHYYLQTLQSPKFGPAIKTGIALFFLLTAGYPSFFIAIIYILLLLFVLAVIQRFKNKEQAVVPWKKFSLQHLLIILVFAGLSLPAIVSFIDLLPYYQRGSGTTYSDTVVNSFDPQHLLSLIFPSSIKATDVISTTDITLRNIYIGIFTILVLLAFPPKMNRRNLLLILLALFAFLFSLGDATPIRKICYKIIPLMDTFRHPSQMRLFFIFAALLLAAPGLKKLLAEKISSIDLRKVRTTAWIGVTILLVITVFTFFKSPILDQLPGLDSAGIKQFLENISLADAFFINGIIQMVSLILFILWLKKYSRNKKIFASLWIANLFIMAQLVLPISFVGNTSPKEINAFLHASPKGFPLNGLDRSLAENSRGDLDQYEKISLATFYNKKIGISRVSYSPAFLDEQDEFLKSDALYNYVASKPVAYLADSFLSHTDTASLNQGTGCSYAIADVFLGNTRCTTDRKATLKKISANHFEIETESDLNCLLVLTQSYHHHWKVWIDGSKDTIYRANHAFMSTPLSPGHHKVVFKFVPTNTITALWVKLATVLLLAIAGIISLVRKNSLQKV